MVFPLGPPCRPRRRLKRLGKVQLGPLKSLIATYHIGDPAGTADTWKPWMRRKALHTDFAKLEPPKEPTPLAQPDA